MPRHALIIRNVSTISAEELKVALQGVEQRADAPEEFAGLLNILNADFIGPEDQLALEELIQNKSIRDYCHKCIKETTGNFVIFHLNGIEDARGGVVPLNQANADYILEKLVAIPADTEFDMLYLGGGHGNYNTGTSNLSLQQLTQITDTLTRNNNRFNSIVLGSCFSAAYSGLYQPLLKDNGVMIGHALECGPSNNFLQAMRWLHGEQELVFMPRDIASERTETEARSACKRLLEDPRYKSDELENQLKLYAYATHTGQELATLDLATVLHILSEAQTLARAFSSARNDLRKAGAKFHKDRHALLPNLPMDFVNGIYQALAQPFQQQIKQLVDDYRQRQGLPTGSDRFTQDEYTMAILPMVQLYDKVNEAISDNLRNELDQFIRMMKSLTSPPTTENIRELLATYPMLHQKIDSIIKIENSPNAEDIILTRLKNRILLPLPSSVVVGTKNTIILREFREGDEKPPNAEHSFVEDFENTLHQIESSEKFSEIHFRNESFGEKSAKNQFNELFLSLEQERQLLESSDDTDTSVTDTDTLADDLVVEKTVRPKADVSEHKAPPLDDVIVRDDTVVQPTHKTSKSDDVIVHDDTVAPPSSKAPQLDDVIVHDDVVVQPSPKAAQSDDVIVHDDIVVQPSPKAPQSDDVIVHDDIVVQPSPKAPQLDDVIVQNDTGIHNDIHEKDAASAQKETETPYQKAYKNLKDLLNQKKNQQIEDLISQMLKHADDLAIKATGNASDPGKYTEKLTSALIDTYLRLTGDKSMSVKAYEDKAQVMLGQSSPGLKVLGGIMLALAAAILVLGIVFFPAVVGVATAVVGAAAATAVAGTTVAVTSAGLLGAAAGGFFAGRQQGVSKDMSLINKEMGDSQDFYRGEMTT